MDYLDFELEISPSAGNQYSVTVIRSPAGEAREVVQFPYDKLDLENNIQAIEIAVLRSGGISRRVPDEDEQRVLSFGRTLFDTFFTKDIHSCYRVSLERARREGKGLRIKLRIGSSGLAALPWEFLYDSHQEDYLCLSRITPIIRYLNLLQPVQPLVVEPPLRILAMISSPHDLRPLNVNRERQRLERATLDLRTTGRIELTWLKEATHSALQQAMLEGPWHIFHFIGHGGFSRIDGEGFLALANEDGETERLSATKLGRLLGDHYPLRLAVLNACEGAKSDSHDVFSSTAAVLVRRSIPAVVAMQYDISDEAAIDFANSFYLWLSRGISVDTAVVEARKAMSFSAARTVEWGTPVLYMHSPDGILFASQASDLPDGKFSNIASQQASTDSPNLTAPTLISIPAHPPMSQSVYYGTRSSSQRRSVRSYIADNLKLFITPAIVGILILVVILLYYVTPLVSLTSGGPTQQAMQTSKATMIATQTGEAALEVPTVIVQATKAPLARTTEIAPTTALQETALPAEYVSLKREITGTFDATDPTNPEKLVKLDAGRRYKFINQHLGAYCRADFPPNGAIWVLCIDIDQPSPTSIPTRKANTSTSISLPTPSSLPSPTQTMPSPSATLTPSSVTYQVNVIEISLDEMRTLPGCQELALNNNVCIVGPGKVNIEMENQYGRLFSFPTDTRQLFVFVGDTVRFKVVSDESGLPTITTGRKEFTSAKDQYYKVVVQKVSVS